MAIAQSTASDAAQRASGSSFYAAMRIQPPDQRGALFEIYGFCRAVDDVADNPGPRDARLSLLAQWRRDVDALYAGTPPERLAGLLEPVKRFGLRREDFLAIIDGMQMDVASDIQAPDWATLDLYCDRVASAVGRLCVRVFGMPSGHGVDLAHHLGRALQLTNILRDVDEDAALGRLYLPREALMAAGINTTDPASVLSHPALDQVTVPVIELATRHFRAADAVMRACPRRLVRTPRVMAAAYKVLLGKLGSQNWRPPRQRARIGTLRLMWIVARYAIV
jgi:squalene synthase HpnD